MFTTQPSMQEWLRWLHLCAIRCFTFLFQLIQFHETHCDVSSGGFYVVWPGE